MTRENLKFAISAGVAVSLLAFVVVWSVHSCRPQLAPVTPAPQVTIPTGGATLPPPDAPVVPKPTQPPTSTPNPTPTDGSHQSEVPKQQQPVRCYLLQVTPTTGDADLSPIRCPQGP